jgi:LysR family transcriptional regulator, flagellar master operon regulator
MDLLLARTFLEVVENGSFVNAANSLNVTHGAVSLRIRSLEQSLGQRLFVRNKAGAVLTPAGAKFQRYAATLTQVWQQAHQLLTVPDGYRTVIHVGGQLSLWEQLIRKWLVVMGTDAPDVFLHTELNMPEVLMDRLLSGTMLNPKRNAKRSICDISSRNNNPRRRDYLGRG